MEFFFSHALALLGPRAMSEKSSHVAGKTINYSLCEVVA
jgi:hypothetical protein